MSHVLIYSRQCEYCNELLEKFRNYPDLAELMEAYEVEDLDEIPDGITTVPAIITANNEYLQSNEAFKWFSHMKKAMGTTSPNETLTDKPPKDLESHDIYHTKNNISGFSIINSEASTNSKFSKIDDLSGSESIDVDDFDASTGKRLYSEGAAVAPKHSSRGGIATRSTNNLPDLTKLIQNRQKSIQSVRSR